MIHRTQRSWNTEASHSLFFCFQTLIRQNSFWANVRNSCICSRCVYLLPYLKPIPHCWETNVPSLPPHPQRCLVADRCLIFMNILCTARPVAAAAALIFLSKESSVWQRLCVTHSAFAVITGLFESSNRTVTLSASGLTVRGVRTTLHTRMRGENLI